MNNADKITAKEYIISTLVCASIFAAGLYGMFFGGFLVFVISSVLSIVSFLFSALVTVTILKQNTKK